MDEIKMENENLVENTDAELDVPEADNTSEETNEASNNGKLGLAIMGLGALAIGGGTVALVKKIKNRKKAKEDAPAEEKKPKEKIRAKRGRKLTAHEILTGHLDEVQEDTPAEENAE